jgi:hypothetical protein
LELYRHLQKGASVPEIPMAVQAVVGWGRRLQQIFHVIAISLVDDPTTPPSVIDPSGHFAILMAGLLGCGLIQYLT